MKNRIPSSAFKTTNQVRRLWLAALALVGSLAGLSQAEPAPPAVTLSAPVDGANFTIGDNIELAAVASSDAGLAQVEFYVDGVLLAVEATAPFAATLRNARYGVQTLTAVAEDLGGRRATGGPVTIQVTFEADKVTLVPNRACWAYWDDGVDPGTDWAGLDYDDRGWRTGYAELGYGDGDERTVVRFGTDANDKPITTYFRRQFSVPDPSLFTNLILRFKRDDGAVVYLNGQEVARDNLPAGPIDGQTLATVSVDDGASYTTANVSSQLLMAEVNTLAVEVHLHTNTSPNLSFDLELLGQVGLAAPPLRIERSDVSHVRLSWPAAHGHWFALQAAATLGSPTAWFPVVAPLLPAGDVFQVDQPVGPASAFFRLTAGNNTPEICQQPIVIAQTPAFTGIAGTDFALFVEAAGVSPFSYQWRLNGQDIVSATNRTFTVTNATPIDGGTYDVVVGNRCGCTAACPIPVSIFGPAHVSEPLADIFAGRASLTNLALFQIVSTNAVTGVEPGEPLHPVQSFGRTVWVEWVAPAAGVVEVVSAGSGSLAAVAVYVGDELTNLVLQACAGPAGPGGQSRVLFNAASNAAYQVQLDNFGPGPLRGLTLRYLPLGAPIAQFVVPPRRTVAALGEAAVVPAQVRLDGLAPDSLIQFQWRTAAGAIPGATNAILNFTNVQRTDARMYILDAVAGAITNSSDPVGMTVVSLGEHAGAVTEPAEGFVNSYWCGTNRWDRHRLYLFRLPTPASPSFVLPRPCASLPGNVDPLFQPAVVNGFTYFPMPLPNTFTKFLATTDEGYNPVSLDTCILMLRHYTCNASCGVLACFDDINRPGQNLLSAGIFYVGSQLGCSGNNQFLKVGVMVRGAIANPYLDWIFEYQ